MEVQGVTDPTSASSQKMDFMQLLITQMQNQNPLEPMSNEAMAAQLAQFSQLELTEEMNGSISSMNSTMGELNSSFQGSLLMAEYDYAKSLLGKGVEFFDPENQQDVMGKVDQVNIDPETGYSSLNVDVKDFELMSGQTLTDTYRVYLNNISGIRDNSDL
jgi:flagellar basal-body rod modification protein FlgD